MNADVYQSVIKINEQKQRTQQVAPEDDDEQHC